MERRSRSEHPATGYLCQRVRTFPDEVHRPYSASHCDRRRNQPHTTRKSTNRSVGIEALDLDPELRREILACLPARKRQRKPSIASLIKRAEKTGKTVTSVTTTADGTTINFGESKPADATADDEVENWLRKQRGH
jgi:hypothetical protein